MELQYNEVYEHIQKLNSSELLDLDAISRALGHGGTPSYGYINISKGI